MKFTLDTCTIIHLLRGTDAAKVAAIKAALSAGGHEPFIIISIVTAAELRSFAMRNKWGPGKHKALEELIKKFLVVPIDNDAIVNSYADIDLYSQGKHPLHASPRGYTSRNLGKNDLWIAATAAVTGSTLVTVDGDFDDLINPNPFVSVVKV
jgi:tRNA(fMet)-specific endonuclease VapC